MVNKQTTKKKRSAWYVISALLSLLLITAGVYLLILLRAPHVQPLTVKQQQEFMSRPGGEQIGEKQLIIPKIAVSIEVNEGDLSVLKKGAWHRLPELGDPGKGGNFIISAHRYILAQTPQRTKQQSYFYNLDKLAVGDAIYVDWHQKRYEYQVTELMTVPPTQLSIESPSSEAKLTLYTCTLNGSQDGRVVIIAKPINL